LNNDQGYSRFSHIDFPGLTLRIYPDEPKVTVEDAVGMAVTSLFPMNFLERRPSYKVRVHYYAPKDLSCDDCHVGQFEAGGGAALNLFSERALLYMLGSISLEGGWGLGDGFRWGPKGEVGALFNPYAPYKLQLLTSWITDLIQEDRQWFFLQFELNQSFSLNRSWEVRLSAIHILPAFATNTSGQSYDEGRLALHYYF
jgi:hypothetical protein